MGYATNAGAGDCLGQALESNQASLGFSIDRKHRTVHGRDRTPEILDNPESVSGDPEPPGFILKMAKVW